MIGLHFSFAEISPSMVWVGFGVVWVMFPRWLGVLVLSRDSIRGYDISLGVTKLPFGITNSTRGHAIPTRITVPVGSRYILFFLLTCTLSKT